MLQNVITLANFNGGIGKSTSTASIGACLAMKGYKVLLVDLDGQSNLTLYYVPDVDSIETSIFDTLINGDALPIINVKPNLDIVPSSLEMASAEIAMTNMLAREQLLTRTLADVKSLYDFILIDCPPSLGIVTTNAFLAADEILVPMTPELLPLKGMKMLDSFVSSLQVIKPAVKLNGVFITRFNHRKLNKVVAEALRNRYADITFKTTIRENISLAESAGSGQSIFEYEPNSNGAKDYLELTNELLNHLNLSIIMAKKNMDALLSNIMGEEIIRPVVTPVSQAPASSTKPEEPQSTGKPKVLEDPWKHFSFICSVELADKVQAIAHKEGFTIRALMEYMMRQGIATYEAKNGKARKIKHKGVTDVM